MYSIGPNWIGIVAVALLLVALIFAIRNPRLSSRAKIGWAVVIILIPYIGPVAYLVASAGSGRVSE